MDLMVLKIFSICKAKTLETIKTTNLPLNTAIIYKAFRPYSKYTQTKEAYLANASIIYFGVVSSGLSGGLSTWAACS